MSTQDGIVGFRVDRRGKVSLYLCARVFSGPREEIGVQSCASFKQYYRCDIGAVKHTKNVKNMKECGIVVDFEWAYKMVMAYDDVKNQSPLWVKSYVEGWRQGYKEGYLIGWTEGTIESVSRMKYYGFSPETISAATGLSLDVIDLIKPENATIG